MRHIRLYSHRLILHVRLHLARFVRSVDNTASRRWVPQQNLVHAASRQ
jgi:hypothetical protein